MLSSLILENFRCHGLLELKDLGQRVVLQGANGMGKTSILEAVYLLSRCKSFRTHRTGECAGWGKRSFGVAGTLSYTMGLSSQCFAETSPHGSSEEEPQDNSPQRRRIKFEWSTAGRQLSIDGTPGIALVDFWGQLPAIAISNADRELVRGSGSNRRNWIDSLAAAQSHDYLTLAQKGALLQRQKNAILKQEQVDRTLWGILTGQMRSVAQEMNTARQKIADQIGARMEENYRQLTRSQEHIGVTSNRETERRLEKSDAELWAMEERSRNCELGPHREDWDMSLESKSLRHFGSEGQQKSAALAMRLAEISLSPAQGVILIDDALIELDSGRRERFWGQLPESAQILYASTDAGRDAQYAGFGQTIRIEPGKANIQRST
jgi:DNA replication and repair protein RecF